MSPQDLNVGSSPDFPTYIRYIHPNCFSFTIAVRPNYQGRDVLGVKLQILNHLLGTFYRDLFQFGIEKSFDIGVLPVFVLVWVLETHHVAQNRRDSERILTEISDILGELIYGIELRFAYEL